MTALEAGKKITREKLQALSSGKLKALNDYIKQQIVEIEEEYPCTVILHNNQTKPKVQIVIDKANLLD